MALTHCISLDSGESSSALKFMQNPEVPLGLKNYDSSTSKLLLAAFCAASGSEVLSLLTKIIGSYTLEMEKPC